MATAKQQIIADVSERKLTEKEIANKYAIPVKVLKNCLVTWGVKKPRRKNSNFMVAPDRDMLISLIRKHKFLAPIAEIFGVSTGIVQRWYREAKVPVRNMKGSGNVDWATFLSEN